MAEGGIKCHHDNHIIAAGRCRMGLKREKQCISTQCSQEKEGKPGTPIMMPATNQGGMSRQESMGGEDPSSRNHSLTNPSADREGQRTQMASNSAYRESVWSWAPTYQQSASGSASNTASSNSRASQTMPTTPGAGEEEEDMADAHGGKTHAPMMG